MTAQTTTSASATAPLASQLAEREAELKALQANFDDYIESSRLLEEELENELEKTQKELSSTKHSLSSLQSSQHTSQSQLSNLESTIRSLTSSLQREKQLRLSAEITTDKSTSHLRQYESRYNVLKEECDGICETLAFRDAENEDLRVILEREREEMREMRREVEVLRQRLEEQKEEGGGGTAEEEKKMAPNDDDDEINDNAAADYTKQLENELELVSSQLLSTRRELTELENRLVESERGRNEVEDCVTCAKRIIDDSYVENEEEEEDEEEEDDVFERTRRGSIEETLSGDDQEQEEEEEEGMEDCVEENNDDRVVLLMKEKEQLAEELKVMQHTMTNSTNALQEENEMMKEELELLHQALEDDKKTLTDENSRLKEELDLLYEELSLTQEDLTEKINEKQAQIESFEAKVSELTNSLDKAQVDGNFEALRVKELNNELLFLKEESTETMKKFEMEMRTLKTQNDQLTDAIRLLKLRDTAISHELLWSSPKGSEKEMTQQHQHDDDNNKTTIDNSKKEEMLQRYKTTMELLRAQNEELQEEISSLKNQLKETQKKLDMLSHVHESELKNMSENDKNVDKMDIDDNDETNNTTSCDKDITLTPSKNTSSNSTNNKAPSSSSSSPLTNNLISSLRSQLARSQSQASMSQRQLRDAQSELSQTRQMLAQVKAKVDYELGNNKNNSSTSQNNNNNARGRKRQRMSEGGKRVVRSHSPMGYKHYRSSMTDNDNNDESNKEADSQKNELQFLTTQLLNEKSRNATLLTRLLHQSQRIQVCCRIKPSSSSSSDQVVDALNDVEVGLYDNLKKQWRSYGMDRVWGEKVNQEGVWMDVEPLCLSVLDGGEAAIVAYGQTGSGKTYTMEGTPDNHGISYRTINKLFQLITHKNKQNHDSSQHYKLSLSMLEIYNEDVHDLLSPPPSPNNNNKRTSLDIRCTSTNQIQIPHLTSLPISNAHDIPTLLAQGHANRATAYTNLNEHSSRSHMVLTLSISSSSIENNNTNTTPTTIGRLSLVDLAGSERLHKSHVTGQQLKEAQHINKSLSALGDVMEALDKKSSHIPYRNSKLTYLLQNALGGSHSACRTMMVVTINPEFMEETRYALQFAQRVRRIDISKTTKSSSLLPAVTERNYEDRIKSLRRDVTSISKAKERLEKQLLGLRTDHARLTERLGVMEREREVLRGEKGEDMRGWKEEREELVGRWQKEKSAREEKGVDLENCHKELRRVQQQLQRANKERDIMSKRQLSFETELATVRKELRQAREYNIDNKDNNNNNNNNNNNVASVVTTPPSKAKLLKKQLIYSSPLRHQYQSTSITKTPPPTPPTPSQLTKKRSLKPPQPPITSPTSTITTTATTREKIITILKTNEPSRLNRLDALLDKFQNREDVLLRKLESRYDASTGVTRSSTESVGSGTTSTTMASSSSPSSSPQTMMGSRRMELAMERHKERMRNFRNDS